MERKKKQETTKNGEVREGEMEKRVKLRQMADRKKEKNSRNSVESIAREKKQKAERE